MEREFRFHNTNSAGVCIHNVKTIACKPGSSERVLCGEKVICTPTAGSSMFVICRDVRKRLWIWSPLYWTNHYFWFALVHSIPLN